MNNKLWQQFLNGEKVAINCKTENEAKEFMKLCRENNIKWNNGDDAGEITNWNRYKEKTCYINKFDNFEGMGFARKKYLIEDCQIITYAELMEDSKEDKKIFTGPELAQAILDGKFKEGTKFKDEYSNAYNVYISEDTPKEYTLGCDYTSFEYATAGALINRTFTLIEEPKEFKFFNQVKNNGKKIKMNGWTQSYSLPEALEQIAQYNLEEIQEAFNKKVWIEE